MAQMSFYFNLFLFYILSYSYHTLSILSGGKILTAQTEKIMVSFSYMYFTRDSKEDPTIGLVGESPEKSKDSCRQFQALMDTLSA
jgi:hypothetical protein